MFDLMVAASNAIGSVVMIGWVWAIIGVLVWLGVVLLALAGEPSYNRENGAVLGSLVGAVLGLITPILLTILPFFLPFILAAAVESLIGLALAHFYKVGK